MTPRDQIMEAVAAEPGIHKSALSRRLDMPWSTLNYHIWVLLNENRLVLHDAGRETAVFASNVPDKERRWVAALRNDTTQAIVDALLETPLAEIKDLEGRLSHGRRTIRRHLGDLMDHGMVEREGRRPAAYRLGEAARRYVEDRRGRQGMLARFVRLLRGPALPDEPALPQPEPEDALLAFA